MKKNVFIVLLVLLGLKIVYGQTDRKYEPVQFENFESKWLHPVIDTSLTGKIFKIKNMDTIYYDGFSLFYSIDNYRVNPVIYKDNMYIVEQFWDDLNPSGSFVECLDINTGKVKWQTHFYKEDNRKEISRFAFINENKQLEILGIKQYKTGCSHCYHLIVRKYDLETGILLQKQTTGESNADAMDLSSIPIFPSGLHIANNYLFPGETGYDYFYFYDSLYRFTLNDSSQIQQNATLFINNDYNYSYDAKLYRTTGGNYMHFLYGINSTRDSFGLYYTYFDSDMQYIINKDLAQVIKTVYPDFYYDYIYNDDSYFIIRGIDLTPYQNDSILMATYSLFDSKGDLIEEVDIPFIYGDNNKMYGQALKLKYEKGMLIVFGSIESGEYLNFFKTDGKGNIITKKQIKLHNNNHSLFIRDITQLENGDILLYFIDLNSDLIENGYNNKAIVYALFSADDMDVKTSNINEKEVKNIINFYPNPIKDIMKIYSVKDEINCIVIYDSMGKKVRKEFFRKAKEVNLDLSFLSSGLYIAAIFNENNKIGDLKFVVNR